MFYRNDNKLFGGSVFQKLSDKLDLGLQVSWSSENNDSSLAVGSQYQLNNDVKLRAKINNKSQLCIGSGIKVKDGVFPKCFITQIIKLYVTLILFQVLH